MIQIKYEEINDEQRVIFISDIHGDLNLFKKLLAKVNYDQKTDVLFINGDLCEKGPQSLAVVRFVMKLQKDSPKVYVTQGNCDLFIKHIFNGNERILAYLDRKPNSLLLDMLEEHGKTHSEFANLKELSQFYRSHFSDEINWLLNLPTVYETEDFIIVHAGIENIKNWRKTNLTHAISVDEFYNQGHQAEKTVIVGHWLAANYRSSHRSSNNPIIDFDKRIICIDGGNRVKVDGQINALILEGNSFSYTYVDHLTDKRTVQVSYEAEEGFTGIVVYPNFELSIIERGEYFTLCKNVNLGINQWVKNEYIIEKEDGVFCKGDVSTTKISVSAGEEVVVIDDQCSGYVLVKKDGNDGWLPKKCLVKG